MGAVCGCTQNTVLEKPYKMKAAGYRENIKAHCPVQTVKYILRLDVAALRGCIFTFYPQWLPVHFILSLLEKQTQRYKHVVLKAACHFSFLEEKTQASQRSH